MKRMLRKGVIILCLMVMVLASLVHAETVVRMEFFYADGCDDCALAKPIIDQLEQQYGAQLHVERLEVGTIENWDRFSAYGFIEVPAVVLNNETKYTKEQLTEEALEKDIDVYLRGENPNATTNQSFEIIQTPFGPINVSGLSLPILTIVLGALDSINPCSFFVLLFLLNLMLYVKSRRRMFLIGGIFIFFSGFIYFLLMTALLGIFLITAQLTLITIIAGIIALLLGGLNIKDFFFFKKGPSLSIAEDKKPKLFQRMRDIVKISYLPSMIIGTVVLAVFANTYELFCTMGFPLLFTKILTLNALPVGVYITYIFFYNVVYILPLIIIVTIFTITLGKRKLSEWQGRQLKLISGLMMFSLGVVLLFFPQFLSNVFSAALLLFISLGGGLLIGYLMKTINQKKLKE